MQIFLLDVGTTKYGDCVLIRHGSKTILIDGAHPGDSERITNQLESILGHAAPFEVDLLVVTHCHSDHIGCLPALVDAGDLKAATALVADEKLGWGRGADDRMDARPLSDGERALMAALHEEDHSDLSDDELREFLEDAATLESKYIDMLATLHSRGTKVVRYGRATDATVAAIERDFADLGLEILGPTKEHLKLCADAIADGSDAIADAMSAAMPADADADDIIRVYRRFASRGVADFTILSDRPGIGAAKNDQSIVLKVKAGGWSALLAADMQFAKAEVAGLGPSMQQLRQAVSDAGPYTFIKLTHHASYNGMDETVLTEWSSTKLFAHTGGKNDAGHPDPGVLDLLKSHGHELTLARTDHNGLITVAKNGAVTMAISKGHLNDFTANHPPDAPVEAEVVGESAARPPAVRGMTVASTNGGMIELIARIPHQRTKVTFSIQVEPDGSGQVVPVDPKRDPLPLPRPVPRTPALRLGGGRELGKLLFVTSRTRLGVNIGRAEAQSVVDAIGATPGMDLLDLPATVTTAETAARLVREKLAGGRYDGTVVLGGYDVVPAYRLDVLDAASRNVLEQQGLDEKDADSFIVWSDDLYGDSDGDYLPEIPVSRIPDGRRADVIAKALQARSFEHGRRFGVRNTHRPFATTVFDALPGNGGKLEISESFAPGDVESGEAAGATYYMLHGSARDATRFWGETQGGAAFEAIAVENVPEHATGTVVFTGCCWGALAMSPQASQWKPGTPLRPRGPEASMAIAYLNAGAQAFVGCTGSHYSPSKPPYDYFGKPMHDAFWGAVKAGQAPARALFTAKTEYAKRIPHGQNDDFSRAVELKILRQFSCLGLGW
jgi:beta-lactamase superfamily II metal-dependent hydrolase